MASLILYEGYCAKGDQIQSIYKGIIPFVILQALGVITVSAFPDIALGLMHFVHDWRSDHYVYRRNCSYIPSRRKFTFAGVADSLIALVYKIRAFVDWCGRWASLLFVPMIVITVYDVCLRNREAQIDLKYATENIGLGPVFESTLLQETEWHLHTALFALVLGFGVVWNTQVRVMLSANI